MGRVFTIATGGDLAEQLWWPQWTEHYFPSYETFWVARVVPTTNRVVVGRGDIGFRTDAELAADGFTPEDVAVAQLHYTLLMHLGRSFELIDDGHGFSTRTFLANRNFRRDQFFESFARLSGASDVADEILARRESPGRFDPWDEKRGDAARRSWRDRHGDPLEPVRAYRNRLVHGRVVPEVYVDALRPGTRRVIGQMLMYPRLGTVGSYLDWRIAFDAARQSTTTPPADFEEAALIAADAWELVVAYVESAWKTHLVPNL